MRKTYHQYGRSKMTVEFMTVQEVELAINAVTPLDTPQPQGIVGT